MTPEEKEVIEAFAEEAEGILADVGSRLEQLESGDVKTEEFATIAGKIDGIMGCAKTLGLASQPALAQAISVISNLSEGCKHLGYKAAQMKNADLIPVVAGFLMEAVEMISPAVQTLKKGYVAYDAKQAETIKERLTWISGRMKLSDADQKAMMARFGL